jgi:3',5'-cyclic AMP phosphodiesterase CpdA
LTGDLAHKGEAGAYEALRDTLSDLSLPVHLMMGNHDSRTPFRQVFGEQPEIDGGFVQFAIDAADCRVLCLDSLNDQPGDHVGRLCETRLAWLDRQVAATPANTPLIVACHHPPFDLGIPNMDDIKLADGEALFEVLGRRKPDLMLFGHVHRPISGVWRGIPFHIQRGFNRQVALTFERHPVIQFCEEAPDLALIDADREGVRIFTRSVGGEVRHFPASGPET